MLKKIILSFCIFSFVPLVSSCANNTRTKDMKVNRDETASQQVYIAPDVYRATDTDSLSITVVGHGSLMFEYEGKIIHVDPFSKVADYTKLPKADLILLTHEHYDHLDPDAIAAIKKDSTQFIVSKVCNKILGYGSVIQNGEKTSFADVTIEAVPAYNIVNKNPDGGFYHPKGRGNGYILTFGDLRVYVAGDTENIPEMDRLKDTIDIAFMPKNLPYTMTDEMFADAAHKVAPKYLYPYHMNEFNKEKIASLINDDKIKIIVKPMSNI